jgi:hypothetical protein
MWRETLVRPLTPFARNLHLAIGVLLPIVFLIVDPAVFRTGSWGVADSAALGEYRAFAYVATVVAAALLLRALVWPDSRPFEAGMLYGATLVALALGLMLLPLSLFGLLYFGVGLLGLAPFAASWVYLRNGARQHAAPAGRLMSRPAALGALLFIAIAAAAQLLTNAAMSWSVQNVDRPQAVTALHALRPIYDADQLLSQYRSSKSDEQKRRLSLAYQHMTGEMLEMRLQPSD